jgi:acylglycerol lipase
MQQHTGELEGTKGMALAWQAWLPDQDPKAAVILSHGLAEHSGRYAHVATCLVRHGYGVYALDHRGHGRSQGRRAQIDRMAYVVDDLHAFVGLVRSEQPAKPLFLLGHSMGGAVAVNYTLEHPDELAGLVLSAPAVVIENAPAVQVRVGKILSAIAPGFPLLALDGTAVSRDTGVVHAYDTDPLNYRGKIPVRTLAELVDTAEQVPDRLGDLRLPILLLQGTADRLVPLSATRLVHDRVSSPDRTLRLYEGLYHEVFNEPERDQVLADLCDWLERHA